MEMYKSELKQQRPFQFPLLGIFPCISSVLVNAMTAVQDTFNSLCLGFFHASVPHTLTKSNLFTVFQFPLLGIFPCILQNPPRRKNPQSPFNSLCLGFFHASTDDKVVEMLGVIDFQFPLLGIFPCIVQSVKNFPV